MRQPRWGALLVRTRLTLLYGGLCTLTGAILLVITYVLVSNAPRVNLFSATRAPGTAGSTPLPVLGGSSLADALRATELHELLVRSGIALGIMAALSIVLSWLVAGRVLRPVRTMTSAIQRISARNVHERLAATGRPDELRKLSDTVDALLARLDAALGAHKRFVANAAHELRTPLTVQHALLEEILLDPAANSETMRATCERVLRHSQEQAHLLEALLTLTEGERGLEQSLPVDLADLAERALAERQSDLDGLEVRAELAPARAFGDPALVARLVGNLVGNAIDHNVDGGFILVRTSEGSVCVENSGTVVPADRVDGLFEPFQRLDRTAQRGEHHGLGLSIVRAIADAHAAVITARPGEPNGLSVTVAFPAPDDLRPEQPVSGRRG
ncbi:MAG TPA: HAMP domain-containing sensor histidine kinase [Pseudonocardiaceae bacterium]|nr:HAMP domain-containing sensor histidine kinase [Pseudonocardiaceae bacterium]